MINVRFHFQDKILIGIECKGHSGYSEKGSDIICAAVSALMQSLILGLHDIAKVDGLVCQINDGIPLISASWPKKSAAKVALLIKTISESLIQIAKENSDYVKIFYSEEKIK